MTSAAVRTACAVRIRGIVQGVGFRPFVHRLARQHGLAGLVRNESGSVYVEVEGETDLVESFVRKVRYDAPPSARCDTVEVVAITPSGREGFRIAPSVVQAQQRLPVTPDLAMCPECETELMDAGNRRFGYPFITCTDCGPRYTLIEAMPYDRDRTTMRVFRQCPACRREYESPGDRRHHSETNSCPCCGPALVLEGAEGGSGVDQSNALDGAVRLLKAGKIVAIRGLGGFHLAVVADDAAAVDRLRRRKHRDAKPLAVMVSRIEDAEQIGHLSPAHRRLLTSRERPIVLVPRRAGAGIAEAIAPGLATVGLMTPYTPLHRLLLDRVGRPLVMTSGNVSDEPIAIDNEEAETRLRGIADAFLLHNREIASRYDDSVVRTVNDTPLMLRRARGYAPAPLSLPIPTPLPLIAVGPHLKNTFTLATDATAFVSQHIGDLENLETLRHFQDTFHRYRGLFGIDPEVAVCDRHPGYLSTRVAHELGLRRVLAVQHHHAHVAAVAAEYGITDPVIGLAYDGLGYGDDECLWGGEVMVADLTSYRRIGHLRYAVLPGGDLAARQPWRSALGFLLLEPGALESCPGVWGAEPPADLRLARRQVETGVNAFRTSSVGRLFDAAAAILGLRHVAQYEGQAAMELEALAGDTRADPLPFPLVEAESVWVMDPVPLLVALAEGRRRGEAVGALAARFHESVAAASVRAAVLARGYDGGSRVVVGGGVFQNARLLAAVKRGLEAVEFEVLVPRELSPNDGSVSYGQSAVAAAIMARDGEV